jgi:hypothetical protein
LHDQRACEHVADGLAKALAAIDDEQHRLSTRSPRSTSRVVVQERRRDRRVLSRTPHRPGAPWSHPDRHTKCHDYRTFRDSMPKSLRNAQRRSASSKLARRTNSTDFSVVASVRRTARVALARASAAGSSSRKVRNCDQHPRVETLALSVRRRDEGGVALAKR